MKHIIATEHAPKAIGPYSQAVRVGDMLFISGQIPLVPETGELVNGGAADQTRQVIENLKAIVTAAGGSLRSIVKTTIFLHELRDYEAVNTVYAEAFGENPPARSAVQVEALPRLALVEIEAIADLAH